MACSPAPVAQRAYADSKRLYPSVTFLGIIGDQAHQTSKSGHNCGAMRELACTNPSYAHAVDIGVPNAAVGYDLVSRFRNDRRVHYVIFRPRGYRPWHRGGSEWASSGHMTHVHVSFGCGSTFQTHPFFAPTPGPGPAPPTQGDMFTMDQMDTLGDWMQEQRKLGVEETTDNVNNSVWNQHKARARENLRLLIEIQKLQSMVDGTVDTDAIKGAVAEGVEEGLEGADLASGVTAEAVADEIAERLVD